MSFYVYCRDVGFGTTLSWGIRTRFLRENIAMLFEPGNPFQGFRAPNRQTLQRRLIAVEQHAKQLYNARSDQADAMGAADELLPAYAPVLFEYFNFQAEADSTNVNAARARQARTQTKRCLIGAQPPLGPPGPLLNTTTRHCQEQLGSRIIGTRVGANEANAGLLAVVASPNQTNQNGANHRNRNCSRSCDGYCPNGARNSRIHQVRVGMEEALATFAQVHMMASLPNFGELLDILADTGQNLANARRDNNPDMVRTYERIQSAIQSQLCNRERILRMDVAAEENPSVDE
jgi:hypothetical protein